MQNLKGLDNLRLRRLPDYHFFEIAHKMLKVCEVPNASSIKSSLEDLYTSRRNKILKEMKDINTSKEKLKKLENITSFELNYLRGVYGDGYKTAYKLSELLKDEEEEENFENEF
jgi:hypothetical protein